MKTRIWLILTMILLAACTNAEPTPTAPEPGPGPTPTTAVSPQRDPTASPEAYPPSAPTPTLSPDNYPPPQPALPDSPYPSGVFTWVLLPAGKQCEDGTNHENLAAAVNDLANAGVAVKSSETMNLAVCSSCGCPTSAHYRAEIDVEGLDTAVSLGWQEE